MCCLTKANWYQPKPYKAEQLQSITEINDLSPTLASRYIIFCSHHVENQFNLILFIYFLYFIYFQQKLTSVSPILAKTVGLAWMVCTNTLVYVQVHMGENDAKVRRIDERIPPQ